MEMPNQLKGEGGGTSVPRRDPSGSFEHETNGGGPSNKTDAGLSNDGRYENPIGRRRREQADMRPAVFHMHDGMDGESGPKYSQQKKNNRAFHFRLRQDGQTPKSSKLWDRIS